MIGEELLRRGILKHRSTTTWLDDLMKEWEKIHTQFIQVFGQASSGDSSDNSKEVSPSNSLGAEDDYYKMLLEDCDRGYERKTSPMMSPIISPVTA
jgi:hypothetical protein